MIITRPIQNAIEYKLPIAGLYPKLGDSQQNKKPYPVFPTRLRQLLDLHQVPFTTGLVLTSKGITNPRCQPGTSSDWIAAFHNRLGEVALEQHHRAHYSPQAEEEDCNCSTNRPFCLKNVQFSVEAIENHKSLRSKKKINYWLS